MNACKWPRYKRDNAWLCFVSGGSWPPHRALKSFNAQLAMHALSLTYTTVIWSALENAKSLSVCLQVVVLSLQTLCGGRVSPPVRRRLQPERRVLWLHKVCGRCHFLQSQELGLHQTTHPNAIKGRPRHIHIPHHNHTLSVGWVNECISSTSHTLYTNSTSFQLAGSGFPSEIFASVRG